MSNSCSSASYPLSDHYDGSSFHNIPRQKHAFGSFLKWFFNRDKVPWPERVETKVLEKAPVKQKNALVTTFINHSTYLLQYEDLSYLTDPIWSERTSPVTFAGPKRVHKPAINMDLLPHIDFVLISHNHYDHLDTETLKELEKRFSPTFFVGLGNQNFLHDIGLKKVVEMDWWQEHQFSEKVKITFVPAQHFSGRTPFDRNETLWGGFVVTYDGKHQVYHAGDTGFGPHFNAIAKKFAPLDLSLLPIGAYRPRWFMKAVHINPEEAVMAHTILRSKESLGMHWGTFQLTDEGRMEPEIDLSKSLKKHDISSQAFRASHPGMTTTHQLSP